MRADLEAGPAERSVLHRSNVSPQADTPGARIRANEPRGLQSAHPSRRGSGLKLNKDTLMGAVLIAAGIVTYLYTRKPSVTRRMLTLIGAAASVIIGALLFFHVA